MTASSTVVCLSTAVVGEDALDLIDQTELAMPSHPHVFVPVIQIWEEPCVSAHRDAPYQFTGDNDEFSFFPSHHGRHFLSLLVHSASDAAEMVTPCSNP